MASLWRFGSIDIFVSDDELAGNEVFRANLKILDATSFTSHFFGAGSELRAISGLIIGDTDRDQLITDAKANTSRTLTSDQGSQGSYRIEGEPTFTRIRASGALLDGVAYDHTTPLYNTQLELIKV